MAALVHQKICVIGDIFVGKTSLVRRFVQHHFDEAYTCTVGAHVCCSAPVAAECAAHAPMVFVIWDVAGGAAEHEQYRTYLEGAAGALVVCDVNRLSSVDVVPMYMQAFRQVNPRQPMIVVGNKYDLAQHSHSIAHLDTVAAQLQTHWYRSSAKTGDQVFQAFHALANQIRTLNQ